MPFLYDEVDLVDKHNGQGKDKNLQGKRTLGWIDQDLKADIHGGVKLESAVEEPTTFASNLPGQGLHVTLAYMGAARAQPT